MQWELVIGLIVAVPVILFPAAFVWYLNIGGIYAAFRDARARKVARQIKESVKVQPDDI